MTGVKFRRFSSIGIPSRGYEVYQVWMTYDARVDMEPPDVMERMLQRSVDLCRLAGMETSPPRAPGRACISGSPCDKK